MIKTSDHYNPSPPQKAFHKSKSKYRLLGGAKGGGKSLALIWEAITWCLRVPGCNVLLLRRTIPELNRGLINLFEKVVPQGLYGGERNWNRSQNVIRFDNGSKLFFAGCEHEDDVKAFNGPEFVFIGIDELTEFTYQMWEYLTAQNRCPVKFDINNKPVIPCMAGATNPVGIGKEWVKAVWVDGHPAPGQEPDTYIKSRYEYIPADVYDNPAYKDDKDYLATLESRSYAWREAFLKGNWDVNFEGQFFDIFKPGKTCWPHFDIDKLMRSQYWQPKWISIDWGFAHSTSIHWHTKLTVSDLEGNQRTITSTYREMVVDHMGERPMAQMICDKSRYNDDAGLSQLERIQSIILSKDAFDNRTSRNSIAQEMNTVFHQNHLPGAVPNDAGPGSRISGWRLMYELLVSDPPMWVISDACPKLIGAIPKATRNPDDIEDVLKRETMEDDILDEVRYGLKSPLVGAPKPFQVQRHEFIEGAKTNTEKFFLDLSFQEKWKSTQKMLRARRRWR